MGRRNAPATLLADDQDLVAVPRRIIFIQGFLFGAIAIVFFIFGIVVGSHSADKAVPAGPHACQLSGEVAYKDLDGQQKPDSDSVVLVVPVARRPDPKIGIHGLRVTDAPPAADHPNVTALVETGGGFARTNRDGAFRVRVPDTGRYFVLVISQHAQRKPTDQPRTRDLAQMGRYLLPASEVLGQQRYSWQEVQLRGDQEIAVSF